MKIKKPREINVQTLFHYWANNVPNLALTIGLVAEIPQIVEMLKKIKIKKSLWSSIFYLQAFAKEVNL